MLLKILIFILLLCCVFVLMNRTKHGGVDPIIIFKNDPDYDVR